MQTVLLALLAVLAVAAIFVLIGGSGELGVTPLAPAEPSEAEQLAPAKIKIEIPKVITWDGSPADVPVMLTGEPLEIEFVIQFPSHLVRVSQAQSSANWETEVIRSNQTGEIFVRAKPIRTSPGSHRLLTVRFHRIERANAELRVPKELIRARFPSNEPFEVEVVPGAILAPAILR